MRQLLSATRMSPSYTPFVPSALTACGERIDSPYAPENRALGAMGDQFRCLTKICGRAGCATYHVSSR